MSGHADLNNDVNVQKLKSKSESYGEKHRVKL